MAALATGRTRRGETEPKGVPQGSGVLRPQVGAALTSHICSWKNRRSFSISSAISAPLISVRIIPCSLACSFFSFSILVLRAGERGGVGRSRPAAQAGWPGRDSARSRGRPLTYCKGNACGQRHANLGLLVEYLLHKSSLSTSLSEEEERAAR